MKKSEFLKQAAQVQVNVTIGGNVIQANATTFSSGNLGFGANSKVQVRLPDGTVVPCQLSMSLTAIKSKDWDN